MNVAVIVSVLASLGGLSGIAAIVTALVNSRRGSAQSETEARAQFTEEFKAIVAVMDAQYARLESQMGVLQVEVRELRAAHQDAEQYIDLLIVGISDGSIPPIPARE